MQLDTLFELARQHTKLIRLLIVIVIVTVVVHVVVLSEYGRERVVRRVVRRRRRRNRRSCDGFQTGWGATNGTVLAGRFSADCGGRICEEKE